MSSVNHELDLPKDARIFPFSHVSLLKSADPSTSIQATFHHEVQKDEKFEVERILEKRDQNYLLKWKDCSTSENRWKSLKHLTNCQKELQ